MPISLPLTPYSEPMHRLFLAIGSGVLFALLSSWTATPAVSIRPGQDYALFFATADYEHFSPLVNPVQDAERIASELAEHYGFTTEVVKNPDLQTIELKLEAYRERFAKDQRGINEGQLLIFFSGHGVTRYKNGFFIPRDGDEERLNQTAFPYALWRDYIDAIDCKHILVMIDACFSGTFDPFWWSGSRTDPIFQRKNEPSERDRLINLHDKYRTRKFLSSGTEVETPDKSNFSYKFLEALKSDGGPDGVLTYNELLSYLELASPKPHSGYFGDDDPGSNFLFISTQVRSESATPTPETDALTLEVAAFTQASEVGTIEAYETFLRQFPEGQLRGSARLSISNLRELQQFSSTFASRSTIPEQQLSGETNEQFTPTQPNPKEPPLPGRISDNEAGQAYNQAHKSFTRYEKKGDLALLTQAVKEIEIATGGRSQALQTDTWLLRGRIYDAVADRSVTARLAGRTAPEELATVEAPIIEAADSFRKALELVSRDGRDKAETLTGLQSVQGRLRQLSTFEYEAKAYVPAHKYYQATLQLHDILKQEGGQSLLKTDKDYLDEVYKAGLAAYAASLNETADLYFQKLRTANYDQPVLYEALYKLHNNLDNRSQAYDYLAEGRKRYPDNTSLLFTDINHLLAAGRIELLPDLLERAIKKEPGNISLYTTMGSVYDKLQERARAAGDSTQTDQYFTLSKSFFEQALQLESNNFDAIYSIAALHYNRAAHMSQQLQTISDDYSQEGIRKYDALKEDIFAEFDRALPYFQRAEQVEPNDPNVLTALREIYARKDNLALSNEFKDRLEKVNAGGSNTSYFKNRD